MIKNSYIGIVDGGFDGMFAFAFPNGQYHFGDAGMIRYAAKHQAQMMSGHGMFLGEFKTRQAFKDAVAKQKEAADGK